MVRRPRFKSKPFNFAVDKNAIQVQVGKSNKNERISPSMRRPVHYHARLSLYAIFIYRLI